jgi:hypothetical protein
MTIIIIIISARVLVCFRFEGTREVRDLLEQDRLVGEVVSDGELLARPLDGEVEIALGHQVEPRSLPVDVWKRN